MFEQVFLTYLEGVLRRESDESTNWLLESRTIVVLLILLVISDDLIDLIINGADLMELPIADKITSID